MRVFRNVNEVRRALDRVLQAEGDSHDGAHYVRPDGTRGPTVHYLPWSMQLSFAVERNKDGGWVVSKAWWKDQPFHEYTLDDLQDELEVNA